MGDNTCTTVAVRYQFLIETEESGIDILKFVPHEVIELECEISDKESSPEPSSNEDNVQKPEDVVYEDDVNYLRSLDPKEWKKQDHYKVLGIESLRIKATDEIIKTAYRKKVLKHHPDKRKALGEEILSDDDYFTCITMAYEILGNSTKRRSYDSIDPHFDNNIPSSSDSKQDFFKVFPHYFVLNARWSEKKRVPKLGDPDATRECVEYFYSFWYDFKSWREYSYEDEEDKEKCSDRDERRYVDKLNKAERLRKKKEEMSRIRSLVDMAYNLDPRIAKFKQEDKDRKLAAKRAKQTAAQARKEEEERLLKEAQLAKEKAEAAERAKIEAKRQEREAQKKALKKERKYFRDVCKLNNYYIENNEDPVVHMSAVDRICEIFSALELEDLNKNLKNKNGRQAFVKAVKESEERIEAEKRAILESISQKTTEQVKNQIPKVNAEWTQENLQLLIKAVNLFPAGTNQRWDVVANFINQHGIFKENSNRFNSKLVLAKAKDLQSTDFSKNNLKEEANRQAFNNFQKDKKMVVVDTEISKKIDSINGNLRNNTVTATTNTTTTTTTTMTNGTAGGDRHEKKDTPPWTAIEQQLLEQALKTYPSNTPERWDRIADCIPNRSKKECMKRYKELVETIKAKKAAQALITNNK